MHNVLNFKNLSFSVKIRNFVCISKLSPSPSLAGILSQMLMNSNLHMVSIPSKSHPTQPAQYELAKNSSKMGTRTLEHFKKSF